MGPAESSPSSPDPGSAPKPGIARRLSWFTLFTWCALALYCDIWPQSWSIAVFIFGVFLSTIPPVIHVIIQAFIAFVRRGRFSTQLGGGVRWEFLFVTVVLVILGMHLPLRITFELYRESLEQLAESIAMSDEPQRTTKLQIGPYFIDQARRDQNGGVYLRTNEWPDGLGPDIESYGFARRPSGRGTPFGNAYYSRKYLSPDWYAFSVSDDY